MRNLKILLSLSLFAIVLGACKKNELGGKAVIKGTVTHHETLIPGARVFVKFNAKEFPGSDTTKYDHHVVADGAGKFRLEVYKGDYFLYGYGYDAAIKQDVKGGTAVTIKRTEEKDISLAITE